ncbi:hypothetical protein K435DRAFT_968890 [Dendrothele bispora CBS 962.96]|uniref:ZNF598/HEL2 PAH domain-containing protein n=1 Tax=Dendrothele bispora (strain CBS 962.96) TaxID=1314807 RepID=A0A4S8LLJ8_DENBC|nr:hypothetical protein K435DRAFT_968890 [Dendrothele bispora CBS 962.96]
MSSRTTKHSPLNPTTQMKSKSKSKTPNPQLLSSAQSYLSSVQSALSNNPEAYNAFLSIMSDFRDGRISIPTSMHRITTLFLSQSSHYPHLVSGYNLFLPPGYKIEFVDESSEIKGPHETKQTTRTPRFVVPPAPN